MINLQNASETPTKPGRGTKTISAEQLKSYREFMDMLEYLDEEKAPEVGLTFDMFESELL